MKILLDTCVWGGVKKELEADAYDVIWTGDWSQDPGDEDILKYAYENQRILVTLDKDFGEIAIVRRIPHHGILRLVNIPARKQGLFCLRILRFYGSELYSGAIVTAEADRIRIRPPDKE